MNIIKIIELLEIIIAGIILLLFVIVFVKLVKIKRKTTESWSFILNKSYEFFTCKLPSRKMPKWCPLLFMREPSTYSSQPPSSNS